MKYFCYFDYNGKTYHQRSNPPAGATKLFYIAKCLSEIEPTEIVSASGVIGKKSDKARIETVSDNLSIRYFFSLGRKSQIIGKIGTFLLHLQLFLYLFFNVSKEEKILVYHSLGYMKIIHLAKKIKKFKMILEIEEIYADVIGNNKVREKELSFFECADGFLFPTKMLSDVINSEGKPEIIIHGTYKVEPEKEKIFSDDKIHIVYAGTLDPRKGGISAVKAAEYLPSNYHIHIIGFGSKQDINNIKRCIDEISKRSKAMVTYDGLLSGEEYIKYIQSCDIGLSPQDPTASFNATSFPSKILSYLSNGLSVVSIRIPTIEQSAIGKELYYFDVQTPQEIASAIISVDLNAEHKGREIINRLNDDFKNEISKLLED